MRIVEIQGQTVRLASPDAVPDIEHFHGREDELNRCRAAWGIGPDNEFDEEMYKLNFRLQGPPGVGKNELVYQLVREIANRENIPFYMIQGHEELTPEDLTLILVPEEGNAVEAPSLVLRASPLATALYEGGIFFFDEINRVPERALAPLASVLDSRQYLYSAMTGIHIRPKDLRARQRFRFCCALNPLHTETGRGGLPDYISERTLPAFNLSPPSFEELCIILQKNFNLEANSQILEEFKRKYGSAMDNGMSVRQALAIMMFTFNRIERGRSLPDAMESDASF